MFCLLIVPFCVHYVCAHLIRCSVLSNCTSEHDVSRMASLSLLRHFLFLDWWQLNDVLRANVAHAKEHSPVMLQCNFLWEKKKPQRTVKLVVVEEHSNGQWLIKFTYFDWPIWFQSLKIKKDRHHANFRFTLPEVHKLKIESTGKCSVSEWMKCCVPSSTILLDTLNPNDWVAQSNQMCPAIVICAQI